MSRAACKECDEPTDAGPCPLCGAIVCQLCAEREGAFCCEGEPAAAAPGDARKRHGFASMSAERRREIARVGGRAAHAQGKAHRWTKENAAAAGRKGGLANRGRGKTRGGHQ